MKSNPHVDGFQVEYLFPRIAKMKDEMLRAQPDAELISLGIGDTTEPLPRVVVDGLREEAARLGTAEGYSGYGPDGGIAKLRQQISDVIYGGRVDPESIFVSDGSKCDLGRLQLLLGSDVSVAIQDPAYPAYQAASQMIGQKELVYMPCLPENDFLPDLTQVPRTDVIIYCSPNNPTGVALTRQQMQELVDFAKANRSLLIFDVAYEAFIRDPNLPRSIYEIPGAEELAIETGSFSKMIGFTGLRLGWTTVPEAVKYDNGSSVRQAWTRVLSGYFNGASNIVQAAGSAVLSEAGMAEVVRLTDYYLENARIIRDGLTEMGIRSYGGTHCPYIWAQFPGEDSWDVFQRLLHEAHIVTTPGAGFGPSGQGFVRISGFGQRKAVKMAVKRMNKLLNTHL